MLAELKNVLAGIRADREAEFENEISNQDCILGPPSGSAGLEIEKELQKAREELAKIRVRKDLLRCELPFMTDIVSLSKVRRDFCLSPQIKAPMDSLITQWESRGSWDYRTSKRRFVDLLRKHGCLSEHRMDMNSKKSLEKKILDFDCYSSGTQRLYLSLLNSLWRFVAPRRNFSLYEQNELLSLRDAGELFDGLELRALQGNSISFFEDILLMRTLFYARSMPTHKLMNATFSHSDEIVCGDKLIQVPQSLIKLWKPFDRSTVLQPQKVESVYQKASRLGMFAKLSAKLHRNSFRNALDAICFNALSLDEVALSKLPRR